MKQLIHPAKKILARIYRNQLVILVFLLFFFPGRPVFADDRLDSLFRSEEVINMVLRTNFSAIQEDRAEDPDEHDGELLYFSAEGDTVLLTVKVMARGNFRRSPENCDFPPLMVNFKKKEVENTLFDNQNKMKLVTPCQNEEYLLEELLIYKMYNLVSDISHKVRLVNMLYFDTGKNKRIFEKLSFFLEDEDHVAERHDSFEKDKFITPFDMNQENIRRMSLFQFMIGNKDWYITSRHNISIIQPYDTTQAPYALPYDFDFADFIDADYTRPKGVPAEMLESRRIYKGLCYTREEFDTTFDFYRKLKPEFESIIMNMEELSKFSRKQAVRYIDYFYKVIDDDELTQKEIFGNCKTRKDYFQFE